MVFECCGGLVITDMVPPTCPKCHKTAPEAPRPVKPRIKVPEVSSWSDDALEALYDAKYTFGSDSTTVHDGFRAGFELGMSIVTHSDIWEKQPILHQHAYAPRGLYLYKDRICKDCQTKFSPTGPTVKYCDPCRKIHNKISFEHHAEQVRIRRRKAKYAKNGRPESISPE